MELSLLPLLISRALVTTGVSACFQQPEIVGTLVCIESEPAPASPGTVQYRHDDWNKNRCRARQQGGADSDCDKRRDAREPWH